MSVLAVVTLHNHHAMVVRVLGHGLMRPVLADRAREPDQHAGLGFGVGRDRVFVLGLNVLVERWGLLGL